MIKINSVIFATVLFWGTLSAQNKPFQSFESALLAQDRYPAGLNSVDWFPDDLEVQGVTNDGANWFFTITNQGDSWWDADPTDGYLWRIPKGVPLSGDVRNKPGVLQAKASDIPELRNGKHVHWGDPDHVRFEGVDYILVPIYTVVACFRADNLKYINYANFDDKAFGGWCAIGSDMGLYSSPNNTTTVVRYEVDWKKLTTPNSTEHKALSDPKSFPLIQADGSPLYMTDMQGGEFSSTGEMLYLVSGRGYCKGKGAPWSPRDGIHAIKTEDWREVARSVRIPSKTNYFSYEYDPTCVSFSNCPTGVGGTDTPEGLTFWDLEDGSAPGIRGSLHVLHDRYLIGGTGCDDELTFHHFSTKVYVKPNATGGPGLLGRPDHEFGKFRDAINYYPIWNGARIILRPGEYSTGPITINKRVQITSEGGAAKIK